MYLIIRALDAAPPGSQAVEVVERKGLGHPDTLCDAIAEHASVALCHYYRDHFGTVLHHNVDKVLLCGGAARVAFGGGEILEPIEVYLAGRATREYGGARIPVHDIVIEACREVLRRTLPELDVEHDTRVISRLRPGSADLAGLFVRGGSVGPLANDTSCGAGFAPLTDLERVVLEVERELNGGDCKRAHPEIGADAKVMGVRRGARIALTIGCAFVARFVRDANDYVEKKDLARTLALEAARRVTALGVDAVVNAADDVASGSVFITVTGTSAESGDDGEVGRGNRTCGLITPYRPMTLEAAAGKNPVSHVGKLYNLAASRIAGSIAAEVPDVSDATCVLVSEIGRAISDPLVADVRVGGEAGGPSAATQRLVTERVRGELAGLAALREAVLEERAPVF